MGVKGTGKTKQMIELVNSAIKSESGNVICLEWGKKLTYDIDYRARLIDVKHYETKGFDFLKGFISGLYAGNYDITHIFIDSLYKFTGDPGDAEQEAFFEWMEAFSAANGVKFTITISADISCASDAVKKYF